MVIFHSYVSLPEGIRYFWDLPKSPSGSQGSPGSPGVAESRPGRRLCKTRVVDSRCDSCSTCNGASLPSAWDRGADALGMPWGCLGDGGVLKRYEVPRIQGVQQRGDVRWVESTINYRSLKLGDSEKHLTENNVRWRETDNLNHFRNPQLRADHGPKSI